MAGVISDSRQVTTGAQAMRRLDCDRDKVFEDICGTLFDSLTRSDQRRKGMQYLRGLLDADGRKSIRNIATRLGGPAFEQSLHHFVVSSTWDWRPMREALAR